MKANRASYNKNHNRTASAFSRSSSKNNHINANYSYSRQRRSSSAPRMTDNQYTRATMGNSAVREYGFYENGYTNYNSSSVAQDFYYDVEIPIENRKRRAKRVQEKEIIQLNMPKTIASIAVVFALSLSLLCAYAINSSYRGEISAKQAELAEIQEENQYLKNSLEDNIDLNKVAREAEKLGLQKPQAYQITEVQVPNESYTVQYDANIATQDKSVWEFLKSILKK